ATGRARHLLRDGSPGDRRRPLRGGAHAVFEDRSRQLAFGAAAGRGQRLRLPRNPRHGGSTDRRLRRKGDHLMAASRPFDDLKVIEIAETPGGEMTGYLL